MPGAVPESADLLGNLLSQQDSSKAAWQAIADLAAALHRLAIANGARDVSCLSPSPAIITNPTPQLPAVVPFESPGVIEGINSLLTTKAAGNRSDRYLEQLRYVLSAFAKGRGRKPLASVTASELEEFVSRKGSPRTRKNRILYLRLLYTFAQKRGWVTVNPAATLEIPSRQPGKIGIHTPEQVKAILAEAMRQHKGVARALAIRYFAGLRTAETVRLLPENIHKDRGFIEVPAAAAKTRRRRLVKIQPNLSEWLEVTEEIPGNLFERVEDVWRAANVPWPNNVTRHSFVSYHLARFENAAKTALEAGHSEAMLFAHYRELVTPDAAVEFWKIVPESGNKKAPTN